MRNNGQVGKHMRTILAIILAIYVAAAAGAEGTRSSTAPAASGKEDQLIDQLLTVSGMKRSLQRLPVQMAGGLMQAAMRAEPSEGEQLEFVKAMEQAFAPGVFVEHVSATLKKNYDEHRYAHFVQVLSAPLAQRMNDLEAQDTNPAEVRAFFTQVAKNPLPPARIKLLRSLDAAMQSSVLLTRVTVAALEAGASAAGDDCSAARVRIKKMIAKSRPEIEKTNRTNAQMALAFTYRDVSNADLETYLKIYEDKDSQWVLDTSLAALDEQFKVSMEQGARAVKKVVQAHKRKKTMFSPKCGQSESPNQDEPEQSESVKDEHSAKESPVKQPAAKAPDNNIAARDNKVAASRNKVAAPNDKAAAAEITLAALDQQAVVPHKAVVRKVQRRAPGTDLRYCLNLATSAEVIACAEK